VTSLRRASGRGGRPPRLQKRLGQRRRSDSLLPVTGSYKPCLQVGRVVVALCLWAHVSTVVPCHGPCVPGSCVLPCVHSVSWSPVKFGSGGLALPSCSSAVLLRPFGRPITPAARCVLRASHKSPSLRDIVRIGLLGCDGLRVNLENPCPNGEFAHLSRLPPPRMRCTRPWPYVFFPLAVDPPVGRSPHSHSSSPPQ